MNKPKPDLLLHAAEGGEPESATSTLLGTTALSSEAPTVVSPVEPTPPAEPDPYDLASLRLTQAFTETVGTKKLITTVPVRKPKKQEWVRVHPGLEYRDNFAMIELKEENEEYIVAPPLIPSLVGEYVNKTLFTAINRQGVLFLWPVPLPDPEGRQMIWHRSLQDGAEMAMKQFIRCVANKALGAYEVTISPPGVPEPVFPDLTFQEIIKIAFRDRLIWSIDHPVIKRLRGLS